MPATSPDQKVIVLDFGANTVSSSPAAFAIWAFIPRSYPAMKMQQKLQL